MENLAFPTQGWSTLTKDPKTGSYKIIAQDQAKGIMMIYDCLDLGVIYNKIACQTPTNVSNSLFTQKITSYAIGLLNDNLYYAFVFGLQTSSVSVFYSNFTLNQTLTNTKAVVSLNIYLDFALINFGSSINIV